MCRNGAVELAFGEILLTPEVAVVGLSTEGGGQRTEGFHVNLQVLVAHIEDAYANSTVGERTAPNLDVAFLLNAVGLLTEHVLVDGVHFVVAYLPDKGD